MKAGSSPHTRGAPHAAAGDQVGDGIIPAYAGSTSRRRWATRPVTDHPRIRGEHQEGLVGILGKAGSSPHTRGALSTFPPLAGEPGIIPAYAGSTDGRGRQADAQTDHPRIRGEHGGGRSGQREGSGSSPHTRGAPDPARLRSPRRRIIPAYAGSTRPGHQRKAVTEDHPRIRGEHGTVSLYVTTERRDHPRIRGEHFVSPPHAHRAVGSSPHTRGARTVFG